MKKNGSYTAYFFLAGILVIFSAVAAFFFGLFPMKPIAVATGSMEPTISVGDAVIVSSCDTNDLNVGDIISYSSGGEIVIHRIVRKNETDGVCFITKGDANNSEDISPVSAEQVLGKVVAVIPKLGYPSLLLRKAVS